MDNKCGSCKRAYIAQNNDWVVCRYWHDKWDNSKLEINDFVKHIPYSVDVATGWGSLSKPLNMEESWATKGTATSGLIKNNCLCVNKDGLCEHYC